jgi:hypothetical protein
MVQALQTAPWVYVAIEIGLAGLLASGPRTVDELASATSTHAPSLTRLQRGLAAIDVVRETSSARLELTRLGAMMLHDSPSAIRALSRLIFLGADLAVSG